MRVFLSWSGSLSRAVATTLANWLPLVVSPAKPWMSEHDIQAGAVWEQELTDNLQATDCGVLVLTRENQGAPWLLFEAGVLSKSANRKRVIPYRVDVSLAGVAAPLTRFQGVDADFEGTKKLVASLNSALPEPIPKEHLNTLFEILWPRLQSVLSTTVTASATIPAAKRSPEDYLEEILGVLRSSKVSESCQESHEASPELAIKSLGSEIESLGNTIASMEEYERKGGGASSLPWWDGYVERHRRARSFYLEAWALVERAKQIPLSN